MESSLSAVCISRLLDCNDIDVPFSDLRDLQSRLHAASSQVKGNVLEFQLNDVTAHNIFQGQDVFTISNCDDVAQQFIGRVFNWRFGWAEAHKNLKGKFANKQTSQNHEATASILDQFIKWLLCHPVSSQMIQSLSACIELAKDRPIVRNQTSIHLVEWYRYQLEDCGDLRTFSKEFDRVKESLLLVVQDVWSAIRNACISRLSTHIIPNLNLEQLQSLYTDLVAISSNADKSWQAREGAIMGVHCIMKKFHWTSSSSYRDLGFDSHSSHFIIFGNENLECMPEFISSTLKHCVFPLLKHEQLTIRSYAVKTFTTYISKCDLNIAVNCFHDVLQQLCQGIDLNKCLPHMALGQSPFSFLDPYEAESLLGICIYLIKHIPPQKLECHRTVYFSAFRLYLSHPASTVRLACSSIFKFIVARDSSNADSMKYILQGLCCEWVPDMDTLCAPLKHPVKPLKRKSVTANILQNEHVACTWEYREGRLLAYELIMQFLIKNHWLYTFGASYLNNDPVFYLPDRSKCRRRSSISDTMSVQQMLTAPTPQEQGDDGIRNRRGSMSKTKPKGIPAKAKTDYPLSSSAGVDSHVLSRLATVSAVTHASSHVTHKHFSYYTENDDASTTESLHLATSLLIACQNRDLSKSRGALSPRTVDIITSDITDPCVLNKTDSSTANSGQNELPLESLTSLLERILYENMECLADGRWELRRMGFQLLPCLVEVIRWFDMKILEDIWDNQLKADTTLLSYTACLTLKFSVAHAARLQHILKHPPSSWQDHALCKKIILRIVDPIRLKMSGWSQLVYMILQERAVLDKLSVVAVETLMLIHTRFDLTTGQKYAQLNRIITVIKMIFCKAHETSSLAKQWASHSYTFRKTFRSPTSGFLSCNVRNDTLESGLAKQVEKHLLNEIHHILPYFLKMSDAGNTHELLPVLCCYLSVYSQDDELCKALFDSIHKLITQCNQKHCGLVQKSSGDNSIVTSRLLSLDQLGDIISTNTLDQHTFKQICDVYLSISQHLSPSVYLSALVTKLTPKLNGNIKPTPKTKGLARNDTEVNLLLNAPSAPLAPIMNEDQSSSDDEENIAEATIKESQTLNASVNSTGSGKGHLHQAVLSDESDEGSDWDSWDDDDASQIGDTGFTEAVTDLLSRLHRASDKGEFVAEINKLPMEEKDMIRSLLVV